MLRLRVGVRNEFVRGSLEITDFRQKLEEESRCRWLDLIKKTRGEELRRGGKDDDG